MESNIVNLKECKYSASWLEGFKKRLNVALRMLHGEAESSILNEQTWAQFAVVKAALCEYEPQDIYNMDEMGLFYRMHPNKTLRDHHISCVKRCKDLSCKPTSLS